MSKSDEAKVLEIKCSQCGKKLQKGDAVYFHETDYFIAETFCSGRCFGKYQIDNCMEHKIVGRKPNELTRS